jgi:hypothetical protein
MSPVDRAGGVTLVAILNEVAARIARTHDHAADGEIDAALIVLEDLELDVERALAEIAIYSRKSEAA